MDIYLVGGAIRDELLGLPVTERDWVVVGATPEELTDRGFRAVGRDFPVFLHPETGEEYALARTERKTGTGHRGFQCDSSTTVTLEEDLQRRDFTINAIARQPDGTLIDPYGGRNDLEDKVLRHISPAFEEDPLRVIRAARFKAKLHHLGFTLHQETVSLLHRMVARGDLAELAPERIFGELEKALQTSHPAEFFTQLQELGANQVLWPEIDNQGIQTLARIGGVTEDPIARFVSTVANRPVDAIEILCLRYRMPSRYRDAALLVTEYYDAWKNVLQMNADAIVDLLEDVDAFRRSDRFKWISNICRLLQTLEDEKLAEKNNTAWVRYQETGLSVRARDIDSDVVGPALGQAIRQKRIELMKDRHGS
ncbi:MAG: multifunctional CCA tRNA nucleotidyl transferase/2'3'-cyclic phosphodiesterase/2'nucleotidase/phosphatase [Pseudomonadales bacterium]